jgi:hypothetical protein
MHCNGHIVLGEVRGEGAYMRWRDVCATCGTRSPSTVAIEFCIPENHNWYCTSTCHAVAAVQTRSTEPDNQDGHVRSRQARWACGQSRRPYYDDHGSSYDSDSRKAYGKAVIARILQMRCNGHTVLGEVRGEGA